jgi:hypothetical protein
MFTGAIRSTYVLVSNPPHQQDPLRQTLVFIFFQCPCASFTTTTMADHPKISTAQAPFDDVEADAILRSCDRVDFYVYKAVLAVASAFFKNMFSLPQTAPESEQTVRQSAPVVDFTEESRTLDHLLRLCYPITDPVINKLTEVEDALEAAIKYQMDEATAIMRGMLRTHGPNEPLKVYVIACLLNLEAEAKDAAWYWRGKCPKTCDKISAPGKLPDWTDTSAGATYLPEMAQISAGSLFRLLRFVRIGETALKFLEADHATIVTSSKSVEGTTITKHPFVYEDADIVLRSLDGVDFRVHKLIISLASTGLIDNNSIVQDYTLPVITVSEDGRTLAKLLELCYPMTHSDLWDLDTADEVLGAATKYKMTKVIQLAKMQCMGLIKEAPLRVYFTAIRCGWKEEARVAARCVAKQPIENVYVPEMKFVSAVVYHRLLKYHYTHRSVTVAITCAYEKEPNETWTAEFSNWWNGGNETAENMLIAGPIVQRELRASRRGPATNRSSSIFGMLPSYSNVGALVDESRALKTKLSKAFSEVSRAHRLV